MKIGTRGSQLAMWQARFVESELRKIFEESFQSIFSRDEFLRGRLNCCNVNSP